MLLQPCAGWVAHLSGDRRGGKVTTPRRAAPRAHSNIRGTEIHLAGRRRARIATLGAAAVSSWPSRARVSCSNRSVRKGTACRCLRAGSMAAWPNSRARAINVAARKGRGIARMHRAAARRCRTAASRAARARVGAAVATGAQAPGPALLLRSSSGPSTAVHGSWSSARCAPPAAAGNATGHRGASGGPSS